MRPEGNRRAVILMAACGVLLLCIAFDLVPALRGPAPYPPEWQWTYAPKSHLQRLWPAFAAGAGIVGLLALAGQVRRRWHAAAVMAATTVLGFALQLSLLHVESGDVTSDLVHRTASPVFTSHFTVATSTLASSPARFLDEHAELLAGMHTKAVHSATHPPGAVLYYRGLLAFFQNAPGVADALLELVPREAAGWRWLLERLSPVQAATALAGALGLMLCCAMTCWFVAALARWLGEPLTSAVRLGVFWPLVPGGALMVPELDQALALPVTAVAALLVLALRSDLTRRGIAAAVGAGALGGMALQLSYGTGAFLVVVGFAALSAAVASPDRIRRAAALAALSALVALAVFFSTAALGHSPLLAAKRALTIHHIAYTAPRSYLLWLVFTPLDVALFVGPPVVAMAWLRARAAIGTWRHVHRIPSVRFAAALSALLVTLLLAGFVRGEAARIFIPLMPVMLVASLSRSREESPLPRGGLVAIGTLQLLFCLVLRSSWLIP